MFTEYFSKVARALYFYYNIRADVLTYCREQF